MRPKKSKSEQVSTCIAMAQFQEKSRKVVDTGIINYDDEDPNPNITVLKNALLILNLHYKTAQGKKINSLLNK